MTIGIICALDIEAESIVQTMTDRKSEDIGGIRFEVGKISDKTVVCAICGIGKVCAAMCAQTMIVKYSPDAVINTGIAGTLTEELGVGDIALSTALVQHDIDVYDLDRTPLGHHPSLGIIEFPADKTIVDKIEAIIKDLGMKVKRGVIATGDQFISKTEIKEKLSSVFGAIACEMEGGAIAQVCYMNKVPFAVVRSISDGANENSFEDYNEFKTFSAKKSSELAIRFVKEM